MTVGVVGAAVGINVNTMPKLVGAPVGAAVGIVVGPIVGITVGARVGAVDGMAVGEAVGATVGREVGADEGDVVGISAGGITSSGIVAAVDATSVKYTVKVKGDLVIRGEHAFSCPSANWTVTRPSCDGALRMSAALTAVSFASNEIRSVIKMEESCVSVPPYD